MIPATRLFTILCLASLTALAQEKPADDPHKKPDAEKKEEAKPADRKPDDKSKEEKPKESKGSVTIGGTEIKYLAKTGTLPLLKDDGSGERARVFFVYYTAVDNDGRPLAASDPAKRPITYCFNGGPGSSAVWLHFGGLGPKKVEFDFQGLTPTVRGPVVPNPQSILDVTDLVFIDPVGTGASRPSKGEKGEQFWNVNGDIESVGEFIRSFTTRELRWASPKYLCGESYGGVRGASLPAADKTRIAEKLARLTGLDRELIERAHLVINPGLFYENLLRKEGKIVGRFDARVTSEDYEQLRNQPEFDPSYTNVYGSFAAAANASIRGDLNYEFELPYRILGGVSWSWKDFEGEEVNVEDRLARALKTNPRLRGLFCLGWRDLAVPPDTLLYSLDHLPIPDTLRKNLSIEYYESGHMMYLFQPDAEKLRRDIVKFITAK